MNPIQGTLENYTHVTELLSAEQYHHLLIISNTYLPIHNTHKVSTIKL